MLHIALQVENKDELDRLYKIIKEQAGILHPIDFDRDKSGVYIVSTEAITLSTEEKTIDDFSDEEIENEYFDRGL